MHKRAAGRAGLQGSPQQDRGFWCGARRLHPGCCSCRIAPDGLMQPDLRRTAAQPLPTAETPCPAHLAGPVLPLVRVRSDPAEMRAWQAARCRVCGIGGGGPAQRTVARRGAPWLRFPSQRMAAPLGGSGEKAASIQVRQVPHTSHRAPPDRHWRCACGYSRARWKRGMLAVRVHRTAREPSK